MDDPKQWRKKMKDEDGKEYRLDLVEEFFPKLDLR